MGKIYCPYTLLHMLYTCNTSATCFYHDSSMLDASFVSVGRIWFCFHVMHLFTCTFEQCFFSFLFSGGSFLWFESHAGGFEGFDTLSLPVSLLTVRCSSHFIVQELRTRSSLCSFAGWKSLRLSDIPGVTLQISFRF